MSVKIDFNYGETILGDIHLCTPGLYGMAELLEPTRIGESVRAPSEECTTQEFEDTLSKLNVVRQDTVAISETEEISSIEISKDFITHVFKEPAIKLEIPAPSSNWGQFVLAVDESGVSTWSFAITDNSSGIEATRGSDVRTYLIPRHVPRAQEHGETRGLASAVGKKIIKVFIFPLVDKELGKISQDYAANWEVKNRPYCVRTFTPDDYNQPIGSPINDDDWDRLSKGRALLMIHGTFSRACNAFAGLPKETVTELEKRYDKRVFAFDHFTLSENPVQNVKKLIELIPEGTKLDLDIICHSRGGLVSRVLSEMQSKLSLGSRRLNINCIIFVASPNSGTILADSKYMGNFIDAHTNILNFYPSNGVTDILEGIIITAKMLAIGASGALPGLQSMVPNGEFISDFNTDQRTNTRYYALTSHFGTENFSLKDLLSRITNCIFHKPNDLVVPTHGVYENNGNVNFPIEEHFDFLPEDEVSHSGYFSEPKTQELILKWLTKA